MYLMRTNNTEKEKTKFEPSKIILPRIMKVLLENGSIGRSTLTTASNTNYPKLAKHLVWLEQNSYVEFSVEDRKFIVRLTESGRDFALRLASMPF